MRASGQREARGARFAKLETRDKRRQAGQHCRFMTPKNSKIRERSDTMKLKFRGVRHDPLGAWPVVDRGGRIAERKGASASGVVCFRF